MPDYSNIMGMMGLEAPSLPEYFGQYFEDVDPRWSQYMGEQFGAAETALGELPGLRRGMLGQLRGGLQERGAAIGRGVQARRAGAGFAGAGAFGREARTARRGLGQEYGLGMYGIGQDIARKEAGVLGGLRGQLGSFMERLMAAGVTPAGDDGYLEPPPPEIDYTKPVEPSGPTVDAMNYYEFLGQTQQGPSDYSYRQYLGYLDDFAQGED
ncbi:hypothetical protein LCGC14_1345060 [marine sediment metagenome]|uniref:Uncharacterized protein n=1 Tax=marine sediment metagenome TaxID=412755 RepID=A0A0F9MTF6_9ZZZZ